MSCLNCGMADEHTTHMLYDCEKMKGVIEIYELCLNRNRPRDEWIKIDLNMMLFHHFVNIDNCNKRDINDMLMVAKHVLYRIRFRENVERRPTVRMLILICIIELQKLVLSRTKIGTDVIGLKEYICELRKEIHWD